MTLPTLEREPDRNSQRIQSIYDMLTTYNQQQKSKQLAELIGIPKDKRDQFASLPPEWQHTYASMFQKERAGKEKLLAGSKKYLKGALPEDLSLENQIDEIAPIYESYINQGLSQSEARDRAIADYRGSPAGQQPSGEGLGFLSGLAGVGGSQIMELLKNPKMGGIEPPKEPFSMAKAGQIAKSPFVPGIEAVKGHPGKAAAAAGVGQFSNIEKLMQLFSRPEAAALSLVTGKQQPKNVSETLMEKIQSGVTEQQKKGLSDIELVSSLLNIPETILGKFLAGGKGLKAISPSEILGPEARQAARPSRLPFEAPPAITAKEQKVSPVTGKKVPIKPEKAPETSLQGRVTKPPETATEMRMERTSPEKRIYPRLQNVELREKQLKAHPKYVEEIATDAAERSKRAEDRVPKTVKGMDAQRIRIHEAEKKWPVAQESYNKAAGRVRALEDEVAKLKGEARESAETLLELAKKDLDDATRNLKNAWENLEGTNYRATVQEMRDAARKKMLEIQDAVTEGEEYVLHKRDYSPDLIAKAKQYSKLKPLPKARQSDFYTQVHDVYVNEYKPRVAQIDKELKSLPKTMEGQSRARPLQKEKEILNKMIQSAEAEKTIQNRRFGLREMAERHKAEERFKGLKQTEGKPEVGKVAQEKMWKKRIEQSRTPEGRKQAANEMIDEAIAETSDPQMKENLRQEKTKLEHAFEDAQKEFEELHEQFRSKEAKEPPSGKGEKHTFKEETKKTEPPKTEKKKGKESKQPPPPPDATKRAEWLIKGYMKIVEDFVGKIPYFGTAWKNKYGRDLIIGVGSALFDELLKETDLDNYITTGQVATLLFGSNRQRGIRYITNKVTKGIIKDQKVRNAKRAYKEHRAADFYAYSPSIQKAAKEKD